LKKLLKNSGLLLIAGLFMISATGLYFTVHQCKSENFTLFFLFTPSSGYCEHEISCQIAHNCCESIASDAQCYSEEAGDPPDSCPPVNLPGCCSDTVLQFDTDDDFVKTERPVISIGNIQLQSDFGFELIQTPGNPAGYSRHSCLHPPGKLHGRQLAFFNRQILL
jgi:hypothetical protein